MASTNAVCVAQVNLSSQNPQDLLAGLYNTYRPLFDVIRVAGRASESHIYFLSLGTKRVSGCRDLEVSNCQSLETYSPCNRDHRKLLLQILPKLMNKSPRVVRIVTNAIKYCQDPISGETFQALGLLDLPMNGDEPKYRYIRLKVA